MANFKSLREAVMEQLNGTRAEKRAALRDVARHGADGGFGGFIYYSDTVPFAEKNRDLIVTYLNADVQDFGAGSVVAMMKGWPLFKHYTLAEVDRMWAEYLTGKVGDDVTLVNALAWYALESVAHQMEAEAA